MARTFSSGNNLVYPSNYSGTAPVTATPFTLAAWCRFSATSIQDIIAVVTNANTYAVLAIGNATAGRICNIAGVSGESTIETTTGITTNIWHHCCATFTSATSRSVYIDGGSSATTSTSKVVSGMVNVAIGSFREDNGTQWGPMSGQIAEAGIWNVALTASEVAALARGIPPHRIRPDALVGYWPIYGLSSPEPDFSPAIQTATRYPMTLVGTPPQYAGHAPIIISRRSVAAPLIDTTATETSRLIPDTVAASTNLTGTGTVASIQDDPDSPDGSWFTATSATTATDLRVTFASPPANPFGSQNFRAQLRKTTGAPTPTVDMQLYQGGSLVSTLLTGTAITSTTGEVVQGSWPASALTGTVDGSDVECRIVSVVGSSAPTVGAMPAYSTSGTFLASATLAATFDVNIPTHAAGDLLVLQTGMRNTNVDTLTMTLNTANWTNLAGGTAVYGGTQVSRMGVAWKIGDGSETVVNITLTGGATADGRYSRVHLFTAADGFDSPPIQATSSALTETGTPIDPMPTVVAPMTNCRAVALCFNAGNAPMTVGTAATNGTWTEEVENADALGSDGTIQVQTASLSGGQTISGGTTTYTNGTSGSAIVIGFALCPADVAGAAVNTVEIGAIEWNATHEIPPAGGVIAGVFGLTGIFGGRIIH